jgi:hypothetical protein
MTDLAATFAERGDLAHLALLMWAISAKQAVSSPRICQPKPSFARP